MLSKKIILSLALVCTFFATNSFAANLYIGGQAGWGKTRQHVDGVNLGGSGLAGRVSAGIQVNPYTAIEAGYTKFHNATTTSANANTRAAAADVSLKGILPLPNVDESVSLFGKIGAAYLDEKIKMQNAATRSTGRVFPAVGAGVSYVVNRNLVTDLSWMRVQNVGSHSVFGNTDFIAVGLAYHFN